MTIADSTERLNTPIDLTQLSPKDARVAIARDVLALLELGKITPDHAYIMLTDDAAEVAYAHGGSLNEVLKTSHGCTVCAIGAALVATVARGETFTIVDSDASHINNTIWLGDEPIRQTLQGYFDDKQVALIECAYEKNVFAYDDEDTRSSGITYLDMMDLDDAARMYRGAHLTDRERMVAIWTNVIENNGTFVVSHNTTSPQ